MGKYFALLLGLLMVSPATATKRCALPTVRQDFAASNVVVAAEARQISVAPAPDASGQYRQTILWRVRESWKGPLYGRDFTTRSTVDCPTCSLDKLKPGKLMILYLKGQEPYELSWWCSHSNFLEYSLKDVPLLYELSGVARGT
jgi:hypothetical protein